MSVEDRMADALTDLSAMLADGTSVEEGLTVCAEEYGFSVTALKLRAEKAFGDLNVVGHEQRRSREKARQEHEEATAIDAYLCDKPKTDFPTWFEERVGRRPTKEEEQEFTLRFLMLQTSDIPREGMYD